MSGALDVTEMQARLAAFLDGLQQLGWTDGRNVRIDTRWACDLGADHSAEEFVALAPGVVVASASANVATLQQTARRFLRACTHKSGPSNVGCGRKSRHRPDSSACR
jgi:putative ABC transport system substrate-binding protein